MTSADLLSIPVKPLHPKDDWCQFSAGWTQMIWYSHRFYRYHGEDFCTSIEHFIYLATATFAVLLWFVFFLINVYVIYKTNICQTILSIGDTLFSNAIPLINEAKSFDVWWRHCCRWSYVLTLSLNRRQSYHLSIVKVNYSVVVC